MELDSFLQMHRPRPYFHARTGLETNSHVLRLGAVARTHGFEFVSEFLWQERDASDATILGERHLIGPSLRDEVRHALEHQRNARRFPDAIPLPAPPFEAQPLFRWPVLVADTLEVIVEVEIRRAGNERYGLIELEIGSHLESQRQPDTVHGQWPELIDQLNHLRIQSTRFNLHRQLCRAGRLQHPANALRSVLMAEPPSAADDFRGRHHKNELTGLISCLSGRPKVFSLLEPFVARGGLKQQSGPLGSEEEDGVPWPYLYPSTAPPSLATFP